MKNLFLFVFLLSTSIFSTFAQQSKIDSLKNLLKSKQADTAKIQTLIALSNEYQQSDESKALNYSTQALGLARTINDTIAIIKSLTALGGCNSRKK